MFKHHYHTNPRKEAKIEIQESSSESHEDNES